LSDLPTQAKAEEMLEHFITTIESFYHILHHPTARSRLRDMYSDLAAGKSPTRTRLAFFLGIFAASAHFSSCQRSGSSMTIKRRMWWHLVSS